MILVTWPNNTFSFFHIFKGFTIYDLFSRLDEEASPFDAKTIHRIIPGRVLSWHVTSKIGDSGLEVSMDEEGGRLEKITLDDFDYNEYLRRQTAKLKPWKGGSLE